MWDTLCFVNVISQDILGLNHGDDEISQFDWSSWILFFGFFPDLVGNIGVKLINTWILSTDIVKCFFCFMFGYGILFLEALFLKFSENVLVTGHQL